MAKDNKLKDLQRKVTPFDYEVLSSLQFGSLDGEKDKLLKDCFIVTKEIRKLLKGGSYNYIISPKGAGKSALFKALMDKYIDKSILDYSKYHFIAINQAFEYDNKYLSSELFKKDLGHKNYTISWALYIAFKLIEDITNKHSNKSNYDVFEKKIRKYEEIKDTFELYNLLDYVNKFNVSLKFQVHGVDCSLSPTLKFKNLPKKIDLQEIYEIINDFYLQNNIAVKILIDRIDNFVQKEEYEIQKNYLQGLIYAIEEISGISNIQPLVFLRTDLYYSHEISFEYDKIKERVIELKWTKDEILFFILLRFWTNEYIRKNYYDFYQEVFKTSINEDRHIKKINFGFISNLIKKFQKNKNEFEISHNIDYKVAESFLKLFFPNRVVHLTKNKKTEEVEFCEWIFSHFKDSNNYINPRTLIRFLNLLVENQFDTINEHNLHKSKHIHSTIKEGYVTYELFMPQVISRVFNKVQNEELKNIYKLQSSKDKQNLFIRINKMSVSNSSCIVKYGDIPYKNYNLEKDSFARALKYLGLLGYLKEEEKVYYVPNLYLTEMELIDN